MKEILVSCLLGLVIAQLVLFVLFVQWMQGFARDLATMLGDWYDRWEVDIKSRE